MSFIEYLASLPAIQLDRLYESHWTCLAVLRSLPPLAKQYVLRLLLVEAPVASSSLQDWVRPEYASKHRAAMERLEQLRVLLRNDRAAVHLNPPYRVQLRRCLTLGSHAPIGQDPATLAGGVPEAAQLEQYSSRQWEAVLLQLVAAAASEGGHPAGSAAPSPASSRAFVAALFVRARLLEQRGREPSQITDAGFRFLLLDTTSQLWELIRTYVAAAEERGKDSGRLIAFLLELGFHTLGQAYRVSSLSELQGDVVEELAVLGLLLLHNDKHGQWFIPTPLAANLSASLSESASWHSAEGYIVVETNFRVYAYTSSRLQTAILHLFMRVEYQLPNLVVGVLSRDSCNAAFSSGIAADQVVEFLVKHAHPHVAQRRPVLPENVTDQIRLWERERKRVAATAAVFYDDFPSQDVFESLLSLASDLGGLLWQDAKLRRCVVRSDLHEQVRAFLRERGRPKRPPTR